MVKNWRKASMLLANCRLPGASESRQARMGCRGEVQYPSPFTALAAATRRSAACSRRRRIRHHPAILAGRLFRRHATEPVVSDTFHGPLMAAPTAHASGRWHTPTGQMEAPLFGRLLVPVRLRMFTDYWSSGAAAHMRHSAAENVRRNLVKL